MEDWQLVGSYQTINVRQLNIEITMRCSHTRIPIFTKIKITRCHQQNTRIHQHEKLKISNCDNKYERQSVSENFTLVLSIFFRYLLVELLKRFGERLKK